MATKAGPLKNAFFTASLRICRLTLILFFSKMFYQIGSVIIFKETVHRFYIGGGGLRNPPRLRDKVSLQCFKLFRPLWSLRSTLWCHSLVQNHPPVTCRNRTDPCHHQIDHTHVKLANSPFKLIQLSCFFWDWFR